MKATEFIRCLNLEQNQEIKKLLHQVTQSTLDLAHSSGHMTHLAHRWFLLRSSTHLCLLPAGGRARVSFFGLFKKVPYYVTFLGELIFLRGPQKCNLSLCRKTIPIFQIREIFGSAHVEYSVA